MSKRLDISVKAVVDNITFSKDSQWAYYRIPNSSFSFLSQDAKVSLGAKIHNAFVALVGQRNEPLEGHLIATTSPLDLDSWYDQMVDVSKSWSTKPGFEDYLNHQYDFLEAVEYSKKVTYLGFRLGDRKDFSFDGEKVLENGVRGAFQYGKDLLSDFLKAPSDYVTAKEEERARQKEDTIFTTLSQGNLAAQRCTAEEILLLIKRQFYPAMPVVDLSVDHGERFGAGDLVFETQGLIKNNHRYLKFNQLYDEYEEPLEGCRAAITLTNLPRRISYPLSMPMLYLASIMGYTVYSRFILMPHSKMKKEVEKKKKTSLDEVENASGGADIDSKLGMSPGDVDTSLQDLSMVNDILQEDRSPWVQASYHIIIEGETPADLKKSYSFLQQQYGNLDIATTWTIGDQAKLFLEQMPGDKTRVKAHNHTTNLVFFATSGFNFSSESGDAIWDSYEGGGYND